MLSDKFQTAINTQINAEFSSSNLYLAMSAYCESKGLQGFGKWFRLQHDEERAHALKLLDYVLLRGGRAAIGAIEAPPTEFGSPLQTFETALDHERKVTSFINRLYETAVTEKDVASQIFLQWFVTEQVEEEANVGLIVDKLRTVGDKGSAVLYLDKELGKRGGK